MGKLLTVKELGDYYGVTRDTIYKWMQKGMPYQITPSNTRRFTIETIEQWIETRKGVK
jgi:excisionase family DNA binding protein